MCFEPGLVKEFAEIGRAGKGTVMQFQFPRFIGLGETRQGGKIKFT